MKPLAIYILVFIVLASGLLWGLKRHYQTSYSREKLEILLTTQSNFRDRTSDPCRYAVFGEPYLAREKYVKVRFRCSGGGDTISTLALTAIRQQTFKGVIDQIAYIGGFDPGEVLALKTWRCEVSAKPVSDVNMSINNKADIVCTKI